MTVITVSRAFGSGGREIAIRVGELLGYRFFDKQLITQAAADVGLAAENVLDFPEHAFQVKTFRERLAGLVGGAREQAVSLKPKLSWGGLEARMDEDWCVELVNDAIRAAYQAGNVVIVGRGGQAILQDQPGVLHVRIEAPLEMRVDHLRRVEGMSANEARRAIEQHDQASARYLAHSFKVRWDDPLRYHLVINTGQWTLEAAAQVVVAAARQIETAPAAG